MDPLPPIPYFLSASLALLAAAPAAEAQLVKGKTPNYPRLNVSVSYQVEAAWPRRPAHCQIADVPGVAVDAKNRVWVFTRAVPPVQVYDTKGEFLFGWGEDTVGRAHHLKVLPSGEVWLSDIGHHVIRKYSQDGKVLQTLGRPGEPGCDEERMDRPTDMAVTPAGDIFVSDGYGNNRIVHFDASGKFVKAWGTMGTAPGEFSLPHAIALDSKGRLYVADRNNARVQVFDQKGELLSEWRNIVVPWGFWVTGQDEVWICGSSPMVWRESDAVFGCPPKDQLFMKCSTEGKVLQLWTMPKGADGKEQPGELNWVHGLALDAAGNIYAGDIVGKRVQKFVLQR
jgi:hypothetical protein